MSKRRASGSDDPTFRASSHTHSFVFCRRWTYVCPGIVTRVRGIIIVGKILDK